MYKILSRKVLPTDEAPEPYKEEEVKQVNSAPPPVASNESEEMPAWKGYVMCKHGYFIRSNCKVCSEEVTEAEIVSPSRPDNKEAAKLLMLPNPKVDHRPDLIDNPLTDAGEAARRKSNPYLANDISRNPNPSLYDDIYPWSAVTVGCKVARRIKTNQIGIVTMLEYCFTDSKHIREVWVEWEGKANATPYTTDELLRLRVQ